MSREAYQAPTLIPQPNLSSGLVEPTVKSTIYICGDCSSKVSIRRGDAIRCKECGYRVLYKERTNRMVQFEAR